jgi:Zn-dependent alcohol dehydrogenase
MVTRRFALEEVNEAFDAMHEGTVVRGVVVPA